jgi:hypothetical protein
MCVNFVDKGLVYDFLLRIGLPLNVGHTAMEKPCPNFEGLKTIFCLFVWEMISFITLSDKLFPLRNIWHSGLPFCQKSITEIYEDKTRQDKNSMMFIGQKSERKQFVTETEVRRM